MSGSLRYGSVFRSSPMMMNASSTPIPTSRNGSIDTACEKGAPRAAARPYAEASAMAIDIKLKDPLKERSWMRFSRRKESDVNVLSAAYPMDTNFMSEEIAL